MDMELKDYFTNKRIFITGAAGTVGKALAEKVSKYPVEELILKINHG
jgi:FlaA1/EpsC-like NDP-sugar epimerase